MIGFKGLFVESGATLCECLVFCVDTWSADSLASLVFGVKLDSISCVSCRGIESVLFVCGL